ncbi:unnamed protein product [Thelazia callipaeda]|uniref:Doublecortin domain-containing protein n=1 Tax=Thelazia callipaeda TaxID=103827 RepID=A0A0N5CLC0_THECL|nr:unnamed protein product [Thelazia callipaeda]
MAATNLNFNTYITHLGESVNMNYRGMRITVYKNGDQYDTGTIVVVSRKRFKHWLTFLDFLTKKLNLMAPVHELYRIDGLHIQHFDEIENGGSYVAVSQGPFLYKPYGLTPEEREKWNISPKIDSVEQGTLDSAESVDIYLKQRGYTSRTGLPFPFDGGICAGHSLMDVRRSSTTSAGQYSTAQNSKAENNLNTGESDEKESIKWDRFRDKQAKTTITNEFDKNSSTTLTLNSTFNVPQRANVQTGNQKLSGEVVDCKDMHSNYHNSNISQIESTTTTKSTTSESSSEPKMQQTVSVRRKDDLSARGAPVVHIPDSSREFSNSLNAEKIGAYGEVQSTSFNQPSPEALITIGNEEASIKASNSSIIVVNISTRQNKRDDRRYDERKESQTTPLISAFDGGTLENARSNKSDMNTPASYQSSTLLPTISNTSALEQLADNSAPSDQPSTLSLTKSLENNHCNENNVQIQSQELSNSVPVNNSLQGEEASLQQFEESKVSEQNKLQLKYDDSSAKKPNSEEANVAKLQISDASVNETENKVNEGICLNSNISYLQKADTESSAYEDYQTKAANKSNFEEEVNVQMSQTSSNLSKDSQRFKKDNCSRDRKRVTLVTPSEEKRNDVDCDTLKSHEESMNTRNSRNSDKKNDYRRQKKLAYVSDMSIDTGYILPKNDDDSIISRKTENWKFHEKYQIQDETGYEADFTPRIQLSQNETVYVKSDGHRTDLDLELRVTRLSTQNSYDPDFKDYDFI